MAILNKATLTSNITVASGEQVEYVNESNILKTNKMDTDITIVKTSEKDWTAVSKIIKVTTTITNNTDQNIEDIKIQEFVTAGATFKENSLMIGSQSYEGVNPFNETPLQVTIGGSGAELVMTYELITDDYLETNQIKINSIMKVNVDSKEFTLTSNELDIRAYINEVVLLKYADTTAVKSNDELTYTIEITNTGELVNTDLYFKDEIPQDTTFIPDSVTINDEAKPGLNPSGFALPTLNPADKITVKFKVRIN